MNTGASASLSFTPAEAVEIGQNSAKIDDVATVSIIECSIGRAVVSRVFCFNCYMLCGDRSLFYLLRKA